MTKTPSPKASNKTAARSAAAPRKAAAKPAAKTVAKTAAKSAKSAKPAAAPAKTRRPPAAPRKRAAAPPEVPKDNSAVLADLAFAALDDLKAVDIRRLDVAALTTIADHMLIASGTSNRHVAALAQNVLDKVREAGHRPLGVEGLAEGEWVLVNLGGVLVHVMQAQARAHYQLEKLWDLSPQETVTLHAQRG